MSEIITVDFDFTDLFHSSDNSIRRVSSLQMPTWIEIGLISCTKWYFKTSVGLLALFLRTKQMLQSYKRNDGKLSSAYYAVHMSETYNKLERYVKGRANGGQPHEDLSIFAALFLIEHGKEVFFEKKVNGRRVDLVSTDFTWLIECGDTNDKPILSHLRTNGWTHSPITYVCVLPFQDLIETPYMYIFQRGNKWDDQIARDIDLS